MQSLYSVFGAHPYIFRKKWSVLHSLKKVELFGQYAHPIGSGRHSWAAGEYDIVLGVSNLPVTIKIEQVELEVKMIGRVKLAYGPLDVGWVNLIIYNKVLRFIQHVQSSRGDHFYDNYVLTCCTEILKKAEINEVQA